MKIHIPKSFENKINALASNELEQFLIMGSKIENNMIKAQSLIIFDDNMVEERTSKHVLIKPEHFFEEVNNAKRNKQDVIISMHSHPGINGSNEMIKKILSH